ncbi:hydrogenase/sulfur reductase gamma subunit [Rhodopirellula maiorica SM1]|uniref:Hydrogenase/sulfur reductase gamma subunit n=1 Tax=Rhodopirellula maiorica SM1 TaxID=1265738 RepID=M5RRC4_9BACT|nr:FAD/NAD(P)-binding protein [Rhodopirellula maiorica]EMI16519.1 hydrogenase/sulfur reductase gamma subunit [Rhodopirellula maiorica SM1]
MSKPGADNLNTAKWQSMAAPLSKPNYQNPWHVDAAVLTEIREETPGVATFKFDWVDAGSSQRVAARPGQFNMLYVPAVGEVAISVSNDEIRSGPIVHTIREVGNVTRAIFRMAVGDTIGVRGPFGSVWPLDRCVDHDVVLVCGGIGLAPMRTLVNEMIRCRDRYGEVHLLIGARTPDDLLYQHEYALWESHGIQVHTTVDQAVATWTGNIGVVILLLERLKLRNPAQTLLMTCGPEVMMMYSIQSAISRGLQRPNIWLSLERNMNCAVATCGHCQFGPYFVCKDGPVLSFDRVERLMEVTDL